MALNDIPSGKVAISLTVKTLASGLSDKLQPGDIIRIYHFLETAEEVPELRFVMVTTIPTTGTTRTAAASTTVGISSVAAASASAAV